MLFKKYAKGSNNCAAAATFDVTERMERDWRKNEGNLRNMPKDLTTVLQQEHLM